MKRTLVLAATVVLVSAFTSSAAVTVQGWWHLDTAPTPTADSSGLGRNFTSAFSTHPSTGGNMGALGIVNGAGGPLGTTGFRSTNCIRLGIGVNGKRQSAMWGAIGYSLPATNFGIEIWALPQDKGYINNSTWIFSSGQAGGVALRIRNNGDDMSSFEGTVINGGENSVVTIGTPVLIDTNKWTHLAIVNLDGTNYFYVNGVVSGVGSTFNVPSTGDIYIGTPNDNQAFDGFLDEARMFTFAPGAFTTNDFLLRPPGPNIVIGPQNATVWDGGAAPFEVIASFDNSLTYSWQRNGLPIGGATSAKYVLPTAVIADTGNTFAGVLTGGSISVTSAPATLTVVPVNPADVSTYRNAINAESSLVAYFPVDGSTGATVTNTENAAFNGTLEGGVSYDGRTNRAFGQRALLFDLDGDVQIPNNPAFEFGAGNGTVEAVVYLSHIAPEDPTFFSVEFDSAGGVHHAFGASRDGSAVTYLNDSGSLSWNVPNLIGRKAHVAFVVQNGTEITAIVDGQPLGTKTNVAASGVIGSPAWIGARGNSAVNNRWVGNIDELAIYNTALSTLAVQTHYSKYFFGTNTAPPSIVSQPTGKTLLAGSSPQLRVQTAGTLPLLYQWRSNGIAIPGATSPTLVLANTTTSSSATYTLYVTNAIGWTNSEPIVLTFITPPSPYSAAVAADGPTAYWRLGETSGTTAVDSAGFNNAIYFPTVTLGAAPVLVNESDPAVDFATGNGRAEVSNVPELNPAGPFTVEAWTRPNAGAGGIILSSQYRVGSRAGYSLHANIFTAEYGIDLGAPNAAVTRLTSTTLPAAGVPVHLVYTYDGVNGTLYVNGAPQASGPVADFVNNTVAPLTIGKRSDNAAPWNGVVDEVAFYNYALSEDRISNHWSFIWTAANITTEPVGVTTNEWATVTLSATATGIPNTYQWQKDGGDLSDFSNPDGTPHYPNGVNGLNLVIFPAHPADSGVYRLVVSNPVGGDTSVNANVVINPDTIRPTIASVTALPTIGLSGTNPYIVKVTFSEIVDSGSSTITGNYTVSGGATVSAVTLSANNLSAYLATSGLVPGQKYTVNVSGISDQAQTPNVMLPAVATAWAPVLSQGLNWDFYPNIPNGIFNLVSSPFYPVAPYTNVNFAAFDSGPFTGGDLNNKPGFPNPLGENYGCSLSGWITPTVTTNYYFYIASDDASELFLSTDADPANAVSIAVELDCCDGFLEPGTDSATSAAIPLTAGVSYFIRALQTEGAGGDYVRVAWKMENDPTPSTNLVAISGSVLKTYAPLPPPQFNAPVYNPGNGQLTVSWTGVGTLYQSTDLVNWTAVPGNPTSPYLVVITGTPQRFYRVVRE
ncbi:MAG TPA: LamG-like jellyroll fold domain-containing protein [Verrucomicrobiae bacterium]|nr:LamG-like jellyroll fold domain-containing protein [Verrucomicrobiae bacterium]